MKKIKKLIIIVFIVLIFISASAYLDYFFTKTNSVSPRLSIKKELDENTIMYTALLYKVYYCKTNDTYTIGSYSDKAAICPKKYEYDNGYYTNSLGIRISKRNLQLLTNDGVYTSEMVENMNSDKQVESSVHVAYNYGKNKYKVVDAKKSADGYKLVVFPEFKEENGNYKWIYNYDEENYYCLKDEFTFSVLEKNKCNNFEQIKMDKTWCENYENSTLIYEENIEKLCEE